MAHFIRSILLFTLLTLILYPVLIFICGRYAPPAFRPNINYPKGGYGNMYSRIQEIKNFKNIDVLFAGSSHAYRGFDPGNFTPLKTFNLGSSAQTPLQTKILFERYLDKLQPKTIVYEVNPGAFSSDGVESSLDIIANDKNDLKVVKMALQVNNIKVYNTLIYGFTRDIFNMDASFVEPVQKNGDTYISGGFVEKKMSFFKPVYLPGNNQWQFKEKQFKAFEQILKMIQGKHINLILVFAPITATLYNAYSNNDDFDKRMNAYGRYYNFNKLVTLTDSLHFFDFDHLNQKGVEIFNKKFIELAFPSTFWQLHLP